MKFVSDKWDPWYFLGLMSVIWLMVPSVFWVHGYWFWGLVVLTIETGAGLLGLVWHDIEQWCERRWPASEWPPARPDRWDDL